VAAALVDAVSILVATISTQLALVKFSAPLAVTEVSLVAGTTTFRGTIAGASGLFMAPTSGRSPSRVARVDFPAVSNVAEIGRGPHLASNLVLELVANLALAEVGARTRLLADAKLLVAATEVMLARIDKITSHTITRKPSVTSAL
jgi:hypothetical protein